MAVIINVQVSLQNITIVVIGSDSIGSYKSNYNMIMTTTVPQKSMFR